MRRAGRLCEHHCGRRATEVHHPRYPRTLGTESVSELIAVQVCHNLNHGVLNVMKFDKEKHKYCVAPGALVPTERVFPVDNGTYICVSVSDFLKGLGVGMAHADLITGDLQRYLSLDENPLFSIDAIRKGKAERFYATRAWTAAILIPYRTRYLQDQRIIVAGGQVAQGVGRARLSETIATKSDRLEDWFHRELREHFLAANVPRETVITNVAARPVTVDDLARIVVPHLLHERGRVDGLDVRVTKLERHEHCTTEDLCQHKGPSAGTVVRIREGVVAALRLANALGTICKRNGVRKITMRTVVAMGVPSSDAIPHAVWERAGLERAWIEIRALNPELLLPE